jgi:hypothetical protein
MPGLSVASIASLTRRSPAVREIGEVAAANLARLLQRPLELVGPASLQA